MYYEGSGSPAELAIRWGRCGERASCSRCTGRAAGRSACVRGTRRLARDPAIPRRHCVHAALLPPSDRSLLLGLFIITLPLTLASVGRRLWVSYKFTSRRLIVTTSSPVIKRAVEVRFGSDACAHACGGRRRACCRAGLADSLSPCALRPQPAFKQAPPIPSPCKPFCRLTTDR